MTASHSPPQVENGPAPTPRANVALYARKATPLIECYGPGPVVHYLGLCDAETQTSASTADIRRRIIAAQERMLDRTMRVWDEPGVFTGGLIGKGCGLGGGAIYGAQNYPVEGTAVTNVAEHAELVSVFANRAGVGDRIHPVVGDFCRMPVTGPFDMAVAVGSPCHMPLDELFATVGQVLTPGGYLTIEDAFQTCPCCKAKVDEYWNAYVPRADHQRLVESIRRHARMFRAYRDRGLHEWILRFQKKDDGNP